MSKIKVFTIFQSSLGSGGVETVIKSIFSSVNREFFEMNLLTAGKITSVPLRRFFVDRSVNIKELDITNQDNGNVFQRAFVRPLKIFNAIKNHCKENWYDCVHIHEGTLLITMFILIAVSKDCKNIIIHSHRSDNKVSLKHSLLRFLTGYCFKTIPTFYLAASLEAGKYIFGKKITGRTNFRILKELIDIDKLSYNDKIRAEVRKRLGVENNFVVGIIGRLSPQKNHFFATDVFYALHKKMSNSKFIIVGEGEYEDELRKYIYSLGLDNSVMFYGVTDNISELYQAFDVLLFPSNWEGLGLVAIEAQSAGLPVVASSFIPLDVKCTDLCHLLPLSEPIEKWAKTIMHFQGFERKDTSNEVKAASWDIKQLGNIMENLYSGSYLK